MREHRYTLDTFLVNKESKNNEKYSGAGGGGGGGKGTSYIWHNMDVCAE